MNADALPQQWTAEDLDGMTEREQQIFFWGFGVGYEECAETRDLRAVFNAGYLAASQRKIVERTTPSAKPRTARHLSVVPS